MTIAASLLAFDTFIHGGNVGEHGLHGAWVLRTTI
jgi:hypothetical protein